MNHPLYFWVFMPYHMGVDTTVVIFISLLVMGGNFTTKTNTQLGLGGTLSIPNFAEQSSFYNISHKVYSPCPCHSLGQ